MATRIRIMDLARFTETERQVLLQGIVDEARAGAPGTEAAIRRRIRDYEIRYEMKSAEMLRRFRAGEIRETAELTKWLFLISINDCKVKT